MQPPYSAPPIPSPYGGQPGFAPGQRGDWSTAPKVVKGWAYPLTWLGIIVLPMLIGVLLLSGANFGMGPSIGSPPTSAVERGVAALLYGVLLGVNIWLNRALKAGKPAAHTVQTVLSCLGLLAFPLGTAIHIYILTQWFRPEVKAWFGRS